MLGKLLKYDLAKYKTISLFYLIAPVLAFVTRLMNGIDNKSVAIVVLDKFVSGITIGILIGVAVNIVMRLFANFDLSLYGDESYLTHTLPVKRGTLYTSKALTGLIVTVYAYAIILLSVWIVTKGVFASPITETRVALLLAFVQAVCILFTVYLGIILGNRKNTHKKLFSILYSVGIYMAAQIVVFLIVLAVDGGIVLNNLDAEPSPILLKLVIALTVVYAIYAAVLYVLGKKALEKGVNVN